MPEVLPVRHLGRAEVDVHHRPAAARATERRKGQRPSRRAAGGSAACAAAASCCRAARGTETAARTARDAARRRTAGRRPSPRTRRRDRGRRWASKTVRPRSGWSDQARAVALRCFSRCSPECCSSLLCRCIRVGPRLCFPVPAQRADQWQLVQPLHRVLPERGQW